MATSEKSAQKGKLELMLDEFTDVHGAVLLGMHKELQTLKADIESRVEARIGAILEQTQSADAELVANINKAQKATTSLKSKTSESRQSLRDESAQLHALIAEKSTLFEQVGAKAVAEIEAAGREQQRLTKEFEQHKTEFTKEIERRKTELTRETERHRTEFTREMTVARDDLAKALSEHDKRMTAAVKFADHLSSECAFSLKAANERYELLLARESALQARTRRIIIAAAIFSVITIGCWAWLLQKY